MPVSGNGAIAIGKNTFAAVHGIAMGNEAQTGIGDSAIAIGREASAQSNFGIAIGAGAIAHPSRTIAIGLASVSQGSGTSSIAIGIDARVLSEEDYSVAIGVDTTVEQGFSLGRIALGVNSRISGAGAVAIGVGARASGMQAVAVGVSAIASGDYSAAIGQGSATGRYSTSLGTSWATAESATALGYSNNADKLGSIALGALNYAAADGAIAIGYGVTVDRQEVAVVGARDIEIARSAALAPQMLPAGGIYGDNPETGVILSDALGVRWRLSVEIDGALIATLYEPTPPIPFEWDLLGESVGAPIFSFADEAIIAASGTDLFRWTQEGGWAQIDAALEAIYAVAADPAGEIIVHGPAMSSLRRSVDAGGTWSTLTSSDPQAWKTVSTDYTGTIIAATYEGSIAGTLLVSADGGASFDYRSIVADSYDLSMPVAAVAGNGSAIYGIAALANPATENSYYSLWRSVDFGVTWEQSQVDFDGEEAAPALRVSYDGMVVIISGAAKTWRTEDGGSTFTTVAAGPLNDMDSVTGSVWVTSAPLRVSTDGGDTFETIIPPPSAELEAVGAAPGGTVYAVFGGGIWRMP